MKKQMHFVLGILIGILLMIALSIQTAHAEDFEFMPASTEHIMEAAKAMKADNTLGVSIIGYAAEWNYHELDDLVTSVRDVEEAFLYVDINPERIVLGLINKGSEMEREHKLKTDGVYIQLLCE